MQIKIDELLPYYRYRKIEIAKDLDRSRSLISHWGEFVPDEWIEVIKDKHPDWFTKRGTLKKRINGR